MSSIDLKASTVVAEKAKETFLEIKDLRKTMPQSTRAQKDELEEMIKEAKSRWWDEVKIYMQR
jgi:hypothetical protein